MAVVQVKALACEPPAESRGAAVAVELARSWPCRRSREAWWSAISASTVRRWLAEDAIKPWQHRSWIFPRDPDFAVKAARVLDLYARNVAGQAVG